jgi:phenylpropionate dioxygenase-like ring-hydroxylating dioxygenase large terminal subunit
VAEFCKEENGLVPVAVAEWGPFVWIHLTHAPRARDCEFVGPLPRGPKSRGGFAGLVWYARKTYDLACNWKVYVDNYLDGGYHVNTVHPGLAGVLDYREYRTVCDGHTVLQSSPIKPADGEAGRTRTGDLAAYWWVYPNFMVNLYAGGDGYEPRPPAWGRSLPGGVRFLLRRGDRRGLSSGRASRLPNRCRRRMWGSARRCRRGSIAGRTPPVGSA